jgi:muramoyltetrapeptide carboxypeptidase
LKNIKPPRLKPGHTIGICSPSSYADPFSLKAGIDFLAKQGYHIQLGHASRKMLKTGFMAAPDKDRAQEIMTLFQDPKIDAIFCAVGGYGAGRLLPLLDFDPIKDNPKILMGYSDITFLHVAIHQRTGLITFHGPSASHLDQSLGSDDLRIKRDNFERALKLISGKSGLKLSNPRGGMLLRTIHDGKASGPLMGGNLETCEETLATPFEINLDRRLFFFEEVYSSPEMVDRGLTHLSMAKKLGNVAGIVAGEFSEVPKAEEPMPSMEEVLRERILPFKKPAIVGLQCGHGKVHVTIPVGIEARLDADEPSLKLKEPPVE